jgi:small GTP-binding protein
MMALSLLDERQTEFWELERDQIRAMLELLQAWEVDPADAARLEQALEQLHELFLLVVVGEFNSGKSALINALLDQKLLEVGVTPTTDRIHILKHGTPGKPEYVSEDIRILRFEHDMLREIHIVDTPGTNAVLRHHEAIVREFIPRSDMVIFVTSADRPFTESERQFLEHIRQWGKKIVVVINKVDILDDQQARDEVERFVREQVQYLIAIEPEIFPLSARTALRRSSTDQDVHGGFDEFRQFLEDTLSQQGIIHLKLLNPLGVAEKIGNEYIDRAADRLQILADDSEALQKVEQELELFSSDTMAEFGRHVDRIENDLLQMQLRGEAFLDESMRLLRIRQMLDSKGMRRAFEEQVVANTPQQIEAHIQEIIDWFVERELRQWRLMAEILERRRETDSLQDAAREASSGFAYNRRQLLDSVGKDADLVIQSFDRQLEARRLTETVRESVALVGLVEVSAISLGLILKAVLTTAAADATGILAAGLLGMLGLAVIPYRRGKAKQELREKLGGLRDELRDALRKSFERELERTSSRLYEAIAPYRRFVLSEKEHLQTILASLESILEQLDRMKLDLES